MVKKTPKQAADYISPLYINGLRGRMLHIPAAAKANKREILFVYGHHSSLERWWGVVDDLSRYGSVTMPDLPGFGGMDSFYKIGEKPSLDSMADYLAAVIKLRYKNRRFTIAGVSFGFLVVTRMLQKHPEIAKKVDILVSIVGFTRYDEFTFSRPRFLFYRYGASFFSRRLPAAFFRNVVLHPAVIRAFYSRTHNAKHKFENVKPKDIKRITEFEVHLWRCNDVRTYMDTTIAMLTVDNCQKKVDLPVWHVSVKKDNYLDGRVVAEHMKVIFKEFNELPINMNSHSVSVIADKKDAAPLIPKKLRSLLKSA